jgi:hypothetical protein
VSAQIFPVIGANLTLPNPLPTQDVSDGTPGSPVPASAMQVAGSDGTNLRSLSTDASGKVKVDLFGNAGVVLDAVLGATKPANVLQVGGNDGTNAYAVPLASGGSSVIVSGTVTSTLSSNTNTTTGDAPTIITATTVNGATQTNANARGAIITAILGTVSGTLPTLSLQLQWSPDGGTTWLAYGAATSAVSIATGNDVTIAVYPTALSLTLGATGDVLINAPLPRTWRVTYTTTGTGISVAVAAVYVNYLV